MIEDSSDLCTPVQGLLELLADCLQLLCMANTGRCHMPLHRSLHFVFNCHASFLLLCYLL